MFDKNYKLLDAAWETVDPAANQVGATPVIAHDYLMREYTAKEEGYVFMYVSNENATLVDVYFDDVVMTHTKSNVIQYNEYYPFGMNTANSWTRENTTGNNFLANGGTELNTISNLYDLDYRNYDPILGRMNGIDPMATKYASLSPYNFSFNDPVTFSDPSGADPYQRSDDTWWVASRTSLYGSRYSGFSSPGDLTNQNPSFDLSANPWAWTGTDPYGDMSGPNMFGSGYTPGAYGGTFRMRQEGWLPEFTTNYTEYSDGTIRINSVRLTGFVKKAHRQQQQQTQNGPTRDAGGWMGADKLYDYLLDHAKNTSVEVAVYELKRGKEATKYFVLPWNRNTKSSSVLPMNTLGKYIPGYSYKDITGVFHTHPGSTPPSKADMAYSDKYNIPIYSLGANGTSYLYLGGTTSVIDLSLYFGF